MTIDSIIYLRNLQSQLVSNCSVYLWCSRSLNQVCGRTQPAYTAPLLLSEICLLHNKQEIYLHFLHVSNCTSLAVKYISKVSELPHLLEGLSIYHQISPYMFYTANTGWTSDINRPVRERKPLPEHLLRHHFPHDTHEIEFTPTPLPHTAECTWILSKLDKFPPFSSSNNVFLFFFVFTLRPLIFISVFHLQKKLLHSLFCCSCEHQVISI